MNENIFEINRYKFNYTIEKEKVDIIIPNNDRNLKEEQKFLDLRKKYKNTREFRYYFNLFLNEYFITYGDQKQKNQIYISFDTKNKERNYSLEKKTFIMDKDIEEDEKYDLINATIFAYNEYKNFNIKDRIEYQYIPTIKKIKYMLNHINNEGYFFISFFGLDSNIIKIINLLLLLFERIIIFNSKTAFLILCFNYNPIIFKDEFLKLLNKLENIKIEPLIDIKELSEKVYQRILFKLDIVISISKNNLNKYFSIVDKIHLNHYINIQYAKNNDPINFQLEDDIKNILNKNHLSINNNKIDCIINTVVGNAIYNLIIKNKLIKCIEIGMDYGIISTYILLALEKLEKNVKLVSMDEYQQSRWHDFGLKLIELNDFNKYLTFYNEPSYLVLPRLLSDKYNLIFISGWNTFDHIMICITFASMLLIDDGYLIINNKYNSRVNKCIKYIDSNYKNFIKITTDNTLVIYKKNIEDNRAINYYNNF